MVLVRVWAILFFLLGCEDGSFEVRERPDSRPNESSSLPGYIVDEQTESVAAQNAATINIGTTTLSIPVGALQEKAEIRLRRLKNKPSHESLASLGEAKGDIVEVTIYHKETDEIFSSEILNAPYQISQTLRNIETKNNIKFVVISSLGTEDENINVISEDNAYDPIALTEESTSMLSLTLTHAIVFAVESTAIETSIVILSDTESLSNNGGTPASSSVAPAVEIDCTGLAGGVWVGVPGNTTAGLGGANYINGTKTDSEGNALNSADFCVMKYEARKVEANGIDLPVSESDGQPWTVINRDGARVKCQSLGAGYTLINNAMWQTIARNIETALDANLDTPNNFANWQNNSIAGNTLLNRGNSDQFSALTASENDNNGCLGITSNSNTSDDCGGTWHVNKRTHQLSTGAVIWDISGNVLEWVYDDHEAEQGNSNFFALNPIPGRELLWGPTFDYSAGTKHQKDGPVYGGLGHFYNVGGPGTAYRGGSWGDGIDGSPFFTRVGLSNGGKHTTIGFRCAKYADD